MGVRFLINDVLQSASLSVSSETVNYEGVRVLNDHIRQTWRSTEVDTEWIKFTYSNSTGFDLFYIGRYNMTTDGIITLLGNVTSFTEATRPGLNQSLGIPTDSLGRSLGKNTTFLDTQTPQGEYTRIGNLVQFPRVTQAAFCKHNNKYYAAGGYYASGGDPFYSQKVYYSHNAYDWNEIGSDALTYDSLSAQIISFGGNLYYMGGSHRGEEWPTAVSKSTDDGASWSDIGDLPVGMRSFSLLSYDSKMWAIGGLLEGFGNASQKVYSSPDGITWTEQGTDSLPYTVYGAASIVYDDKMWIIGGWTGIEGDTDRVYSSPDGITWTRATDLPEVTWVHPCIEGNGKIWMNTRDRNLIYTTDFLSWSYWGNQPAMGAVGERPFSHLFFHDGALYQVSGGAAGSAQRTILTIWTQKPKYNYWRLHAKDSGNSDGYIEVGRVMAGRYIEPDRNISDGFKLQRKDTSRIQMLNGLTGNFTGRDQHEVLEFRYNNVPETYVDQFRGLFNSVGNHKPILVSLFPETRPHHNSYYCQMTSPLKQQHFLQRHFDLPDLTFEEKV